MKRLVVVLAAAAVLAGCSSSPGVPEPDAKKAALFVELVRENVASSVAMTDGQLIDAGLDLCRDLDGDLEVAEFMDNAKYMASDRGLAQMLAADAVATFAYAIGTFCPSHMPELQSYIDTH